eukprot:3636830-Rhodomonas_salina.1
MREEPEEISGLHREGVVAARRKHRYPASLLFTDICTKWEGGAVCARLLKVATTIAQNLVKSPFVVTHVRC